MAKGAFVKVSVPEASRKPALGRGLGALLAEAREPPRTPTGLVNLPIEQVHPDRNNPRRHFDETTIRELAASLASRGLLQPVTVRRDGREYRLIAGERRLRAAKIAGWTEIPAIIREATDTEAKLDALIENLQRDDLNPLEEAEAYRELHEKWGWTQEKIAESVGKDRSSVANAMRLLALPGEVRTLVATGALDMGHARAILGLAKPAEMVALARAVVSEKLSVRETELRVRAGRRPVQAKKGKVAAKISPEARRLVEDLQRQFGTRVRLRETGGGKGTIEVDFFSYEDLDRIIHLMRG